MIGRGGNLVTSLKRFNNLLTKIGDENSQESIRTMRVIRKVGAGSIIAVMCLMMWASTYVDNPNVELTEVDLKKDVRE